MAGDMVQVVEISKYKALSSNASTFKNKKKIFLLSQLLKRQTGF
jgi:hypothetical protein